MSIQVCGNGWILETRHTAYAFGVHTAGLLTHRYWGAKLPVGAKKSIRVEIG